MYSKERREIYKKCMDYWGFDAQARVCQEECTELVTAIFHLIDREREGAMLEVAEELADVYIMVGQMIEYLGSDVIEHIVNCKLSRVEEKLKRYKESADED